MDMQFDPAGQRLFDDACVALERGADDVTVMESALDVICTLLRREEDCLLRDKAVGILSHCFAEMGDGDVARDQRARAARDAAREAIRVVIAERPLVTRPASAPCPGRRASDAPATA